MIIFYFDVSHFKIQKLKEFSKYEYHGCIFYFILTKSLEQCINLKNSQSHTDAHNKTVKCKVGDLTSWRVFVAC